MAAGRCLLNTSRLAVVLTLTLSSPVAAREQQVPARPAAPPRDAPAEQTGTGVIRGRVVAADTGRPLRRARVTISAPVLRSDSHPPTSTDPDGRYEFKDLPAARYRVSVARGGYLPLEFGQRRPGEQGRPVQVADGQVVEKIDFALPRMSVITGRITDDLGEPIEGVGVFAMRSLFYEGRRKLVPVGWLQERTDDAGEYRLSRLAPGTYFVMASTRETWNVKENGRDVTLGYLPTYFPGVINAAAARRVTLGVGQEQPAIDFSLTPGRAARVSGTAVDSKGRSFSRVSLNNEVRGRDGASFGGGPSASVAPDGSFAISNVPPGEYMAVAARMPDEPGGDPEVALMPLMVEGIDIENLTLVGSSGASLSGRVVSETGTLPKGTISVQVGELLRNQPSPAVLGTFRSSNPGLGRVKEDGTFTVEHVFGRARVQVMLPDGWMLKSVTRGADDITDAPFDTRNGESISGVEILITDKITTVSGQLLDARHAPIMDATVLVFPSDTSKWFERSRLVRAARPDQQGQWEIKGLPAGEYFAVALDYVEDTAWYDPEYLESLREYAEKLTLGDAASETIALKLASPK